MAPQLRTTLTLYETTIPRASFGFWPSDTSVEEARFASVSLTLPSRATPPLFLLALAVGVMMKLFWRQLPGEMGQPSLLSIPSTFLVKWVLVIVTSTCCTTAHLMAFTVFRDWLLTTMLAVTWSP